MATVGVEVDGKTVKVDNVAVEDIDKVIEDLEAGRPVKVSKPKATPKVEVTSRTVEEITPKETKAPRKAKASPKPKSDRLITVAGVSRDSKGVLKLRFVNNLKGAVRRLTDAGNTDIKLVELSEPMKRADAVKFLATCHGFARSKKSKEGREFMKLLESEA